MQIVREELLGTFGPWVIKARVVNYKTKQGPSSRVEAYFEKFGSLNDTGFSLEDLAKIHAKLLEWGKKHSEL